MSVLFRGATVVDGTGGPRYVADVLVEGERISRIEPAGITPRPGWEVVDCRGLLLTPGFIDIHAHSELEVLRDPTMAAKVCQGITSEVTGNCGIGPFPTGRGPQALKALTRDVLGSWEGSYWPSFAAYRKDLEKAGTGTNMAFLVSHSALRCAAMEGNPNREATAAEVRTMVELMEEAYDEGCIGFSSGLYYAPCLFAGGAELEALLAATRRYGRFFAVHHRCEGDDVLPSLKEVLDLARRTGVRLEVSHLKALGPQNQDKVPAMLALLHQAADEGVAVRFDQYPYTYGSTSLFSLLPPDDLRLERDALRARLRDPAARARIRGMMAHPEGWDSIYETAGWDQITVLVLEHQPQYEMRTIASIASSRGQDPFDTFFDLLADEGGTALMADVTQSEDSLCRILKDPMMCFGTDALYAGPLCHPRSYNAAVHLLDRYGRRLHLLPWEELIRKMSGEAALRLGWRDRGTVAVGKQADLVLFDPARIEDRSTLRNPAATPRGLARVYVNGVLAALDGKPTGVRAGTVLS